MTEKIKRILEQCEYQLERKLTADEVYVLEITYKWAFHAGKEEALEDFKEALKRTK